MLGSSWSSAASVASYAASAREEKAWWGGQSRIQVQPEISGTRIGRRFQAQQLKLRSGS